MTGHVFSAATGDVLLFQHPRSCGHRLFSFSVSREAGTTFKARSRGAAWLFLESGRDNRRAHDFFTRRGFTEISWVFARRLNG
jgi:hypothetical protein